MRVVTKLQSVCHWMAVLDILFYFGTIVSSVVVENVVSERRAMKFEISDNGTISVSYGEKGELVALWDYLYSSNYTSSAVYNAVYMSLVLIAVSYFIIEIWLSCVLIRGATERSIGHCKRWFWWRVIIILLTLVISASDLYQMQYTLTLLLLIPLNIYRFIMLLVVLQFITELTREDGNEKTKNFA